MPYISIKDLKTIDKYLTKQCELNIPLVRAMTDEEFVKEIDEYHEVTRIFFKLYEKQKELNEVSKMAMREYRKDNPEAKEKAKLYMRKYNKRRKEAK